MFFPQKALRLFGDPDLFPQKILRFFGDSEWADRLIIEKARLSQLSAVIVDSRSLAFLGGEFLLKSLTNCADGYIIQTVKGVADKRLAPSGNFTYSKEQATVTA